MAMRDKGLSRAELSDKLGRSRADGTISQIINRAPDSKTGNPRTMGANQARRIEIALGLPNGWMDTPIDVAPSNPQATVAHVAEPPASYAAWPIAGMTLEQIQAALTPEQRGEVAGMIRAFLSMNAKAQTQQTPSPWPAAPQSTLLTGT